MATDKVAKRLVSAWWLTRPYAFHTFGELCLSPIGLSLVTKLAPLKLVGADDGRVVPRDRRSPSWSPASWRR